MEPQPARATYHDGRVKLDAPADWPEGTRLSVIPLPSQEAIPQLNGHAIIAGFGLSGRSVGDLLDRAGVPYTVVETNPDTVATQRALGRKIVEGSVTDPAALLGAGLHDAGIVALTIPNEDAVLKATSIVRKLRPDIYIVARTNYSSKGMQASQLGADEVIKAEQAVALQFYEILSRRIR